ncbi:DUF1987 domain-containing protein [Thiorhodococcus mannitoliphagus]|uniref:DUF1987 domain-containing protein n=1 Tax=Thiorhodococcus mannitoliphagus TaxID=329406 RepID=A0A6P1E5H9_9GAMM|nr:DUF1987 domain-containing protein [Thiorhodococcus mannitoliphagus]NEX23772.1 DUF1987 domain-containing protein [Thiorhodococcus mannitoliphagus]
MTDTLYLPQTERSPLVELDVDNHRLRIEGESYPEDAAAFFGPVLAALDAYLAESEQRPPASPIVMDVRLLYFNSSSAKALMNVFQRLESTAQVGVGIDVNWHYHPDDETMKEFGEDFSEDFEAARFNLVVSETDLA